MKTLITIAGTLLAGATPFAASAALGHEAATTANAQTTVATWPVPTQAAQRSEGDELEELRRAIAELRAEKDRLSAELAVKRAEAATPSGSVHQEALSGWFEAYQDSQPGAPEAHWPERISESANAAVQEALRIQGEAERRHERSAKLHEAYRQLAEGDDQRAFELERALAAEQAKQDGLILDVEPHAHEGRVMLEFRARLAEAEQQNQRLELELRAAQEHLGGLWVHEDGEAEVGLRWEVTPQSDEAGLRRHVVAERDGQDSQPESGSVYGRRARVVVMENDENEVHELHREALERLIEEGVSEELNEAAIDALLQQLERQFASASESPSQRRVRHLVIDSEGNQIDAEIEFEHADPRRANARSNGERRFGVVTRGSDDGARAVQVDQDVCVEVDGDSRIALISPGDAHSRTFIHDSDRGEQETRVFKSRKRFVRGQDGELVEIQAEGAAPTAPAAPRVVRAPRAPRAPIELGGGTMPPDKSVEREAIRWRASSSAPRVEREHAASAGRDELLREVHVLTKEMLAELRLLRAAVDELRHDVDASHPARSGARSGGR